jgi:hypothetical protein
MHPFTLASDLEEAIPVIAIAGGLMIAALGIIAGTFKSVHKTRAREESRREIAAYVAEGSMSPEDAARLIEAGMPGGEKARRARA